MGQLAALGKQRGTAEIMSTNLVDFMAWALRPKIYLAKRPRGREKLRAAMSHRQVRVRAKLYLEYGNHLDLHSSSELSKYFEAIRRAPFAELWIADALGTDSLCLLTNRNWGFLNYFRHSDGDPGLVAENLSVTGSDSKELEFCTLSGCGSTLVPAKNSLTIDDALKVVQEYLDAGILPKWVTWCEHHRNAR